MFRVLFFFGCALFCSTSAEASNLTIPEAMFLQDLDQHVLNKWMKEVLYVQPDPELGVPYDAGHFNISKTGPNLYNFHFKGEETLENGTKVCIEFQYQDELVSDNRAVLSCGADCHDVLSSDNPSLYLVTVRCVVWEEGSPTCPLSQSFINVYAISNGTDIDVGEVLAELGIGLDTEGLSFYSPTSAPTACQF